MKVKQVTVFYGDNYYSCKLTKKGWKCGKCLFGLINPWGNHNRQDTKCKRCGAELWRTVFSRWREETRDIWEYNP